MFIDSFLQLIQGVRISRNQNMLNNTNQEFSYIKRNIQQQNLTTEGFIVYFRKKDNRAIKKMYFKQEVNVTDLYGDVRKSKGFIQSLNFCLYFEGNQLIEGRDLQKQSFCNRKEQTVKFSRTKSVIHVTENGDSKGSSLQNFDKKRQDQQLKSAFTKHSQNLNGSFRIILRHNHGPLQSSRARYRQVIVTAKASDQIKTVLQQVIDTKMFQKEENFIISCCGCRLNSRHTFSQERIITENLSKQGSSLQQIQLFCIFFSKQAFSQRKLEKNLSFDRNIKTSGSVGTKEFFLKETNTDKPSISYVFDPLWEEHEYYKKIEQKKQASKVHRKPLQVENASIENRSQHKSQSPFVENGLLAVEKELRLNDTYQEDKISPLIESERCD